MALTITDPVQAAIAASFYDKYTNGKKPYGISVYRTETRQYGWVTRGWIVHMQRNGKIITRRFVCKEYGDMQQALAAAMTFRDQANLEFPPLSKMEWCATVKTRNTSGVPGVTRFTDRRGHTSWKAKIVIRKGKEKSATFSINKYGEEGAFQRAVEARRKFLSEIQGPHVKHPEMRRFPLKMPTTEPEVVRLPFPEGNRPNPYAVPTDNFPHVNATTFKDRLANGSISIRRYWTAVFVKSDGRPMRRYFSIEKFGEEHAKKLAIEQRLAWLSNPPSEMQQQMTAQKYGPKTSTQVTVYSNRTEWVR